MKKFMHKLIDLVCFVGGSFLVMYSILHFNFRSVTAKGTSAVRSFDNYPVAITGHYYYKEEYIIIASAGIILIVLGLLIRNWRKQDNN